MNLFKPIVPNGNGTRYYTCSLCKKTMVVGQGHRCKGQK